MNRGASVAPGVDNVVAIASPSAGQLADAAAATIVDVAGVRIAAQM